MRNAFAKISVAVLAGFALSSCIKQEQSPGYEYMPDMYRSPAVEAYVDYGEVRDTLRDPYNLTISARKPVEGTVPTTADIMNDMPYMIPNTQEGYQLAGEVLKSPFPQNEQYIEMGKGIYTNFCVQCHGAEGLGNGPVVEKGGHPAPQAYNGPLSELPEGKMFHTLTYGKGAMGSHASQLTKAERWKVVAYVKYLQKQGNEEEEEETEETSDIKG
ncbi:cytochrome c [Cryomorphaceae bacterium 1068]|nr:cytochrome c [Cryomorphaceae bacterium 1068]